MDNILDKDLSQEEERVLRESLEAWKEETYASLMEEVEVLKEAKIEELEEANLRYREELKEEFANKMINALNEMRDDLKVEVYSEMVQSNPELGALEKVKELIAPLISESYMENTYANTIVELKSQLDQLKEEKMLDEGAKTLAELVAPLSEKTRKLIVALIKEGSSEEVMEQFYTIVENLENVYEEKDDEEDDEDADEEDADDEDADDEDDDEDADDDEDDDEDADDEDDDDEEDEPKAKKAKKAKEDDETTSESFIGKGVSGLNEEKVVKNSLRDTIRGYSR